MTNKLKIGIFGLLIVLAGIAIRSFFSDKVELHTLAPVEVNLTDGWPGGPENPVIGILPKGITVEAKTIVNQDHMVYRVEFQSSNGTTQTGYVMFTGYCHRNFIEIHIRHHLFKADEKLEPNCQTDEMEGK